MRAIERDLQWPVALQTDGGWTPPAAVAAAYHLGRGARSWPRGLAFKRLGLRGQGRVGPRVEPEDDQVADAV